MQPVVRDWPGLGLRAVSSGPQVQGLPVLLDDVRWKGQAR